MGKCPSLNNTSGELWQCFMIGNKEPLKPLPGEPQGTKDHKHHSIFFLIKKNLDIFWLCRMACGILVPWPGIEPVSAALEAWSLHHWTARKSYHSISTDVFWIPLISTSVVNLSWLPHLPPCAVNSSPVGNTLPCRGWRLNIIWAHYGGKKALLHFLSAMLGVRVGWHLFLFTVSNRVGGDGWACWPL